MYITSSGSKHLVRISCSDRQLNLLSNLVRSSAVISDAMVRVWIPVESEILGRRQMDVDVFHNLERDRGNISGRAGSQISIQCPGRCSKWTTCVPYFKGRTDRAISSCGKISTFFSSRPLASYSRRMTLQHLIYSTLVHIVHITFQNSNIGKLTLKRGRETLFTWRLNLYIHCPHIQYI